MKVIAIVNPASANGATAKHWDRLERQIADRIGPVEAVFTKEPGHGIQLTQEALRHGHDHIIAVGGDGTINEVVNGFFDDGGLINPDAVFMPLMRGTGGDFKRSLGITSENSLDRLVNGAERQIDIGRVRFVDHSGRPQVRYFVNISSFGMGGEVGIRIGRSSLVKLLGGKAAYFLLTLRTLLSFKNKTVQLKIDGQEKRTDKIQNVAVANGQFFGGGMWIAPHAVLDSGQFEIVILGDLSKLQLIRESGRFYKGTQFELDQVTRLQGRKVTAASDEMVLIEIDGEPLGRLPATFELLPSALRLRC